MLKTAVFAPTPRAMAKIANRIGTGVLAKLRNAKEKSRMAHLNVLQGHGVSMTYTNLAKPHGCLSSVVLNGDVPGVGTGATLGFIAAVLRRDGRNPIVVSD